MLNEIRDVTQYEKGRQRRWFHDEDFDLYTWETGDGTLTGFQLCYAKLGHERALRWTLEDGYRHDGVDAREDKPGRAMSALFVADGAFDADRIGHEFARVAVQIPAAVREFVLSHIHQVPAPLRNTP